MSAGGCRRPGDLWAHIAKQAKLVSPAARYVQLRPRGLGTTYSEEVLMWVQADGEAPRGLRGRQHKVRGTRTLIRLVWRCLQAFAGIKCTPAKGTHRGCPMCR